MLDSSRFRQQLGEHYGVSAKSVHGYILGEHGDSEVAIWSCVSIGGLSILNSTVLGVLWDDSAMETLFTNVRDSAQEIIKAKGSTSLAIGIVISSLVRAILHDERAVLPVSVNLNNEYAGISDVSLSVPCRVGREGIIGGPVVLNLAPEELLELTKSANVLRSNIAKLKL